MFLKSLSIVLAILLTASLVHNIHLEGLLRDKAPTVFYQENEQKVINQETINQQPPGSIELLPPIEQEQDDSVQDINDVLAINNPPNHSDALFGGMVETKTKKKRK